MRIDELELLTADLAAQRSFYTDLLGLPSTMNADRLTIQAGASRLIFRQAPSGWSGFYHFAFNIPENQYAEAISWISGLVPLLADRNGVDSFHFEGWNASPLYFYDPAGIGVATDDVAQTVCLLEAEAVIFPYKAENSDVFMPVGDEHGLFIVVKRGRIWFPDTGKAAEFTLLTVRFSTDDGRTATFAGPP